MSQLQQSSEAPLISITLPVYNGARFLPESLASIVAQT
jgi:glycosyltransferase involved in cell wall biosynthesis